MGRLYIYLHEIPIQNESFHVGKYTIVPWDDMVHTHTTPQKSNELLMFMVFILGKYSQSSHWSYGPMGIFEGIPDTWRDHARVGCSPSIHGLL